MSTATSRRPRISEAERRLQVQALHWAAEWQDSIVASWHGLESPYKEEARNLSVRLRSLRKKMMITGEEKENGGNDNSNG